MYAAEEAPRGGKDLAFAFVRHLKALPRKFSCSMNHDATIISAFILDWSCKIHRYQTLFPFGDRSHLFIVGSD